VRLVLDVVIAVVAGAAENIGLGGLHFLDGDAGSVLAIALRAFRTAEVVLHAVLAAHRILAHRQHAVVINYFIMPLPLWGIRQCCDPAVCLSVACSWLKTVHFRAMVTVEVKPTGQRGGRNGRRHIVSLPSGRRLTGTGSAIGHVCVSEQ